MKGPTLDDVETLKYFDEKAKGLYDPKYNALCRQRIEFSYKDGVGSDMKNEFPGDEISKSFMMNVRMFIIKDKNRYNFEKICEYFIANGFMAKEVQEWLDVYRGLLTSDAIKLTVGDKSLSTKMVFSTILNEENFHQELDQKGMKYIKANEFIEVFARHKFFNTLCSLRMILCSFNRQIVEKFLEKYGQ